MAVTLVRQQADLCVSVGILMEAGEIFEPIYSLARSAFEFGARAFWLLEPDTTLRERCARGQLMELTSLHHLKDAARYRPDQAAAAGDIASLKTSWKALTESVRGMFADLDLAESGKWSVEGVRYESWTDVAGRWLERSGASVDGRWLYKHLSVRAHPQGLITTPGLGVGAEGQTIRSRYDGPPHAPGGLLMVRGTTGLCRRRHGTSMAVGTGSTGASANAAPTW
ncbi:hypothetical protein ACIA59_28470 [Micromonospora haikouensis]|uniref:hypothetical protein n=1 Tax=Micromonospora haikouensis TaxID=686309 RepID=UPI00379FF58D